MSLEKGTGLSLIKDVFASWHIEHNILILQSCPLDANPIVAILNAFQFGEIERADVTPIVCGIVASTLLSSSG